MSRNPKELTKAEVIARADALDQRRRVQLGRQIDSINRLLEIQHLEPGKRYETEMRALNDRLVTADVVDGVVRAAMRRVRQMATDLDLAGKPITPARILDVFKEMDNALAQMDQAAEAGPIPDAPASDAGGGGVV